jgi:ribosomal protein S25
VFGEPADWRALLPAGLEAFTARDLAQELRLRLELAQRMAYFLREAGIVKLIGKRGRAHLYAVGR